MAGAPRPAGPASAAQQVPGLLHARGHVRHQREPAGTQVPQPRPVRAGPLGQVALQLGHQLADQVGVALIGLVPGVVVFLPLLMHRQRLHAHEPVTGRIRQPHQCLPPVPGRLARHHQAREPRPGGTSGHPLQQPGQLIGFRVLHRPAGQHPALMIDQHRGLLVLTQIDRQHRLVLRDHPAKPGELPVPVPVSPRQPATLSHERPPAVLGSEARHHIRRTFLQQSERSQQVVTTPGRICPGPGLRQPRRGARPKREHGHW